MAPFAPGKSRSPAGLNEMPNSKTNEA
jgi:hypothetical protein